MKTLTAILTAMTFGFAGVAAHAADTSAEKPAAAKPAAAKAKAKHAKKKIEAKKAAEGTAK